MKVHVKVVLAGLATVVSLSRPVQAQIDPDGPCYRCWEEWRSNQYWHYDWVAGISEYVYSPMDDQSGYHPQPEGNWSSCLNAISVAGHRLYNLEPEEELAAVNASNALREGSDAAILALLAGEKMAVLNSDRNALQVIGRTSRDVMLSVSLPRAQVIRLSQALSVYPYRIPMFP
jgi:hypothetical protein